MHAATCRNTPAQAPPNNGTGPDPVLISERILGRPKHPLSTPLHAHTARLHIPSAQPCMRLFAGTPQHRRPQPPETGPDPMFISERIPGCSKLLLSTPLHAHPGTHKRPGCVVYKAHLCIRLRLFAGTPQHRPHLQITEPQALTQCSSLSASWAAPKARPRPGHW
jgi:hypothetical protein